MKVGKTCFGLLGLLFCSSIFAQMPATPDKIYGKLFHDVQMAKVFPDQKTFPDCIPKKSPPAIVADYQRIISDPAVRFSLKLFLEENFDIPNTPALNPKLSSSNLTDYLKTSWQVLKRDADKQVEGSSLLALPYPYIGATNLSQELHYMDAYFTMLGLKELGETAMIENMVKNFAYLLDTLGHIPAGNRTYLISRSEQPFFSLMVEMLAALKGDQIYITYLPTLEREYNYWMEDAGKLKAGQAMKRVVKLPDGTILNRYWDDLDIPRQEAYYDDYTLSSKFAAARAASINRDLRSAAASGWTGSSRWLTDPRNAGSIQTTNIIPVDLNTLLYKLEMVLAKAKQINNNYDEANVIRAKASARIAAIDKYCWSRHINFYTDYDFINKRQLNYVSLAGMYPFCFFSEKPDYMSLLARRVSTVISNKLLKENGLMVSDINSGENWDAPYAWYSMQWMAIWGLDRCGQKMLAADIADKWIKLNTEAFNGNKTISEKYNLADPKEINNKTNPELSAAANGVLLKLINQYGLAK